MTEVIFINEKDQLYSLIDNDNIIVLEVNFYFF